MIGTRKERLDALDSLYPAWEEHTLWTRFAKNSDCYSDRVYLICQEKAFTYRQIREEADRIARSLYGIGVRPGAHVAVFLHNSPVFLALIFALAKLCAVKVPVNMNLGTEEKKYILEQSDSSWAVGTGIPDFNGLKGIVRLEEWEAFLEIGATVSEKTILELEKENRNPYGICDIMYTSGSTSFPKGVMVTHDMLLRSSYGTCRTRLMEDGRRLFVPIPFYHIFAYSEGILPILYVGGTLIIADRRFEAENSLNLMKRHGANDIICVPIVMIEMLKKGNPVPDDYPDMHAAYWASTCPEWVWDAGKQAFGISDVTTGYGMTECGSTSTILPPTAPGEYVKRYVGILKDGGVAGCRDWGGHLIQLKICNRETGEEQECGREGEICCRGLTVTPGYYKNEGANQMSRTMDGWFHTGDLGCLNAEGYLIFTGRKNDTYKINGENVSPQYLDAVIGQCEDVEQVEVVGIRHEKFGETGVAFIDAGIVSDEKKARIEAYCREKLARFQVPEFYVYESSAAWPRTSTGKVKKGKLRERAQHMCLMSEGGRI